MLSTLPSDSHQPHDVAWQYQPDEFGVFRLTISISQNWHFRFVNTDSFDLSVLMFLIVNTHISQLFTTSVRLNTDRFDLSILTLSICQYWRFYLSILTLSMCQYWRFYLSILTLSTIRHTLASQTSRDSHPISLITNLWNRNPSLYRYTCEYCMCQCALLWYAFVSMLPCHKPFFLTGTKSLSTGVLFLRGGFCAA